VTRTRAEALALVNWKGVFYERYLLDEHVTALEGVNGAGKTTVIIAAYVVLLPDMTRLRFTNLGETAATGGDKGLYGRLGDPDGPSYAALDFRLGSGERLLAGVHLERRSEPTVELTPFVVSGLGEDVALQDILLDRGDVDTVPDLNRLSELTALGGGRLRTFSTVSDYFADLFDRGVTPLRLTGDEERTKLNEMLRTSMVGGISRALTGGLRGFLLKPETGLADTLKRMRGNLDACRRTRFEVEAAQRMEVEIHGVYEVGQEMFIAAVHATRERAEEDHQRLRRAQAELDAGVEHERALAAVHEQKAQAHAAVQAELSRVQEELERAQGQRDCLRAANQIVRRIASRETERVGVAAEADRTRGILEDRRRDQERARKQRREAQDALTAASRGLADFQEGLDEFHRRAAAFEHTSRRLREARSALPDEDVRAETVVQVRAECERDVMNLDREIVRLDRVQATAVQRREDYNQVAKALSGLTEASFDPSNALQAARQALRAIRDAEALMAELPELTSRIEQTRELAERQQRIRDTAGKWGTAEHPLTSTDGVRAAFATTDTELEAMRDDTSKERRAASGAAECRKQAQAEMEALERLIPLWRDLHARARELEGAWSRPVTRQEEAEVLRQVLWDRRDALGERLRDGQSRRDETAGLADRIEHSGGQFSDELLRARDAVDGELLAGHFEDVPMDQAGQLQAMLGPLSEAIVVDDTERAARTLATEGNRPPTIWLVDDGTALVTHPSHYGAEVMEGNVLVPSSRGARLTRIPEQPTLGRRARALRVQSLRKDVEQIDHELDVLRTEQQKVLGALTAVQSLLENASLLERDDPQTDLLAARGRHEVAARSDQEHQDRTRALETRAAELTRRRDALGGLLADAHLLDLPDQAHVLRDLELRLLKARSAGNRLERARPHLETLQKGVDVLRTPPPTDSEIEDVLKELDTVRKNRDRLSAGLDALRFVESHLPALDWSDAPEALGAQQALRPALEEQLRVAEEGQKRAEAGECSADEALENARDEAQKAQAGLNQLDAALALDRRELAETGVEDASDDALAAAERRHEGLRERTARLDEQERTLNGEAVEARVRHETQTEKLEELRRARDEVEAQWRPVAERWQRLQAEAERAGVLRTAMTTEILERTRAAGSANLYQEARSKGEVLVDRLARSEGGEEPAQSVKANLDQASQDFGSALLRAWLEAREWLRRRVPPQIAEVDDPLETLARVREHLGRLRERLAQQEKNLRGQTEDVARNIETQRRKAQREVGRLNHELRNVRFGSIHGVQIKVRSVEERERVLQALREGEDAQMLLFSSDMPIEEAMAELFKRYGGQTGGQRLLDYREYLNLQVEVQRQSNREWERANPTRMSTGEAIGVGAAIMMVVLTAWERHANLLRSKRAAGTLRLLFLDEANRLSQDNLGVLFELCQALELQLLIAAPEVAQSEGNTTYRLVRQVDEAGREVVHVSGRRTLQGRA
jgi:chromosome partition protein MukB